MEFLGSIPGVLEKGLMGLVWTGCLSLAGSVRDGSIIYIMAAVRGPCV